MKYTLRQKQHAVHLIEELGSIPEVSRQLNIPERTLRDWRKQARYFEIRAKKDPASFYRGSKETTTIETIRDQLLQQIDTLTAYSGDDPRKAYFASLAIERYLDQIIRLNRAIGEQFDNRPSAKNGGET
ncbi:MAG: helix-turn-helix domain-containing protein [Chloroflexota bacterium]